MREIKFRGLSIDNGEWACGLLFNYSYRNEIKAYIQTGDYAIRNGSIYGCEVDPKTVGQYTGLKDKNGVDIFEGDKVKVDTSEIGGMPKHPDGIYVVVWDEVGCGFVLENLEGTDAMPFDECATYKVTGNIHES